MLIELASIPILFSIAFVFKRIATLFLYEFGTLVYLIKSSDVPKTIFIFRLRSTLN